MDPGSKFNSKPSPDPSRVPPKGCLSLHCRLSTHLPALLPAKPLLVPTAPVTPCKQCPRFPGGDMRWQRGPRRPSSCANTCSFSPLSLSLLVSSLFHPGWREKSLTAPQGLLERDQILSKATTGKSQDSFSVTESSSINIPAAPPSLSASGWGKKGKQIHSKSARGLGDSTGNILVTQLHSTTYPRSSNAIISSGLAGKLD